jgi:exodeoxyribonuclease VII large subunit
MLHIFSRRFPGLHIRIYPALVQGEGSVDQVCRGLRYFSETDWAQVVIVARGGGSLEDLWTFNEEPVARAIAASRAPVISAVGHETDVTIADFVADLRAPTPSAAAELVICTREQLLDGIGGCQRRLEQGIRYRLSVAARRLHEQGVGRATTSLHRRLGRHMQRVDELERCCSDHVRRVLRSGQDRWVASDSRLRRMDLRLRFSEARRRLETLLTGACQAMNYRLASAQRRFGASEAHLRQLSPLRVLDRGYAIVQNEAGDVVRAPGQAPAGTRVRARLASGELDARVL